MTYQIQSSFAENFKVLTDTSVTKQVLTTTYALATGSVIDYVPSVSSAEVIFQYSVHLFADAGTSGEKNAFFKLQYSDDQGSTWNDWGDNTEVYVGSSATVIRIRSVFDIKFCLDASGWTSTKRLRIVVKEDTGSDCALHQFDQNFLDDSNSYANQHYWPSVSCYSVE